MFEAEIGVCPKKTCMINEGEEKYLDYIFHVRVRISVIRHRHSQHHLGPRPIRNGHGQGKEKIEAKMILKKSMSREFGKQAGHSDRKEDVKKV